ncbi:MAG: CRISPR-associated endoribonuclease Cas6 [Lachnotalea sp.]
MRFSLIFNVAKKELNSDIRRRFIAFIKTAFENHDEAVFKTYYNDKDAIEKPYTFSVYFGPSRFTKDRIFLENNRIYLTFSTIDAEIGIHFFNAALGMRGQEFYLEKGNSMTLETIQLVKEKPITSSHVVFKTLSPILIRNHIKEDNKDWYYYAEDEGSLAILKNSMMCQAVNYFGSVAEKDMEELVITPKDTKKLVINHYQVFVTGNVGTFELQGKPYLLEYFYKAGISSKKSEGFGMVDLIREEVR